MERKTYFFLSLSKSPGGHMIYRRNERGAWSAKISPQHSPPPTSWLLTSLPLPQSLYGQRSVVRWRHDQIFLGMGLRSRAKQPFRRNFLDRWLWTWGMWMWFQLCYLIDIYRQRRWYQFSIKNQNTRWKSSSTGSWKLCIRGSKINHPESAHTKFYSRDWLIQSIIY